MTSSIPLVRRRWKLLFTIALVVTFVVFVNYFVQWLGLQLQVEVRPSNEDMIHRVSNTGRVVTTVAMRTLAQYPA